MKNRLLPFLTHFEDEKSTGHVIVQKGGHSNVEGPIRVCVGDDELLARFSLKSCGKSAGSGGKESVR